MMSAESPSISIIIPVFNLEKYIADCIESVIAQTYRDFELIIVDDGSTDRSVEICRRYQDDDSRVIILHNDHLGVGAARNTGLEAARGEYIAFVDGDDTLHERYLELLHAIMTANPETDIAGATFKEIKADEVKNLAKLQKEKLAEASPEVVEGTDLVARMFNTMQFQTLWAKLYRRTLIENNRYGSFKMGGDVPFNAEVYPEARKFVYTETPIYFRLVRSDSICFSTFNDRNFDEIRSVYTACLTMERYGDKYKAEGLKKLYKVIASVGLRATKPYRKQYKALKKDIVDKTKKEFFHSHYISSKFKIALAMFLHLPATYRLFRFAYEKFAG